MFHDERGIRRRLARVVRDWVVPAGVVARAGVEVAAWEVPDEPVPFAQARRQEYRPFAVGEAWSWPWGTTWFRIRGAVPAGWDDRGGRVRRELVVDLGFSSAQPGFQAEGLVHRPDGTVVKGLEPRNTYVPLEVGLGGSFEFFVEAASNPEVMKVDWTTPSPMGSKATAGHDPLYVLGAVEVRAVDTEVEALVAEVDVLDGWVDELAEDSPRRAGIVAALQGCLDALDPDDVAGTVRAARLALAPALGCRADASAVDAYAVGHAHIDSAWLWPVRETVRKVARTFSNALHLMDVDPDFVFAASSAQQYEWVRVHHPDLFARIRQRVAEGRWVVVGGQWVESDPYMIGGEAFVRQFTEGLRFFREHLGVEPREVWLPDSFGYSAALPGIARHAGMRWMLTQKLSWNDTDTFPHHTFRWEGIDGSELFTHFPPVDTYNSTLEPAELAHCQENFREAGAAHSTLVPFGYGDGGGGPTRELVARAHLQADLEGSPRVRLASPVDFFRAAEAEYPDAPVWVGELYLENHRGVLTSQHRTKLGNRRCEHLLREAELWAATAAVREGTPYPHEELHELWRTVLLHQFHDILPGSSIAWVHREAEATYARVEERLGALIDGAIAALVGPGDRELVANPGAFTVEGVPAGALVARGPLAGRGRVLVTPDEGGWCVDNGALRVHVDADGLVDSLVHEESGREVVPHGEVLGRLVVHRDIPENWDAWNIDLDHRRHATPLTGADGVDLVEEPDGAVTVRATRTHGASTYVQVLRVPVGVPRLEFTTEVDWHERHKLLKLDLPLDVHTDHAQSEIQFGHVTRPVHTNTSWDQARFETVALRWVRVAEPGFGVAVANDQTYGHGIQRDRTPDGVFVRVGESLLRAPTAPDPDADQGHHRLTTTLVVGATTTDAIEEGFRLNCPLRVVTGAHEVAPLVSLTGGNAVLDAIKLADDESGDVIVRLHEALGGRTVAVVGVDAPVAGCALVDACECPLPGVAAPACPGGVVEVPLTPFQLVALRFGLR